MLVDQKIAVKAQKVEGKWSHCILKAVVITHSRRDRLPGDLCALSVPSLQRALSCWPIAAPAPLADVMATDFCGLHLISFGVPLSSWTDLPRLPNPVLNCPPAPELQHGWLVSLLWSSDSLLSDFYFSSSSHHCTRLCFYNKPFILQHSYWLCCPD